MGNLGKQLSALVKNNGLTEKEVVEDIILSLGEMGEAAMRKAMHAEGADSDSAVEFLTWVDNSKSKSLSLTKCRELLAERIAELKEGPESANATTVIANKATSLIEAARDDCGEAMTGIRKRIDSAVYDAVHELKKQDPKFEGISYTIVEDEGRNTQAGVYALEDFTVHYDGGEHGGGDSGLPADLASGIESLEEILMEWANVLPEGEKSIK